MAASRARPDDRGVIGQQTATAPRFASSSRRDRAIPGTRALLVTVDDNVRGRLDPALERHDLRMAQATCARTALRTMFHEQPELILLDLALPERAAWTVLERIRELCDAPVIALGATGDEPEIVDSLRAGADVHVARPLSTMEVLAFSAALLRRSAPRPGRKRTYYADGAVELDLRQVEVRVDGTPLYLTPLEMRLLTELMEHPNQTLSSAQLLARVWGDDVTERERVKIYIGYLRAKFRSVGAEAPIVTVRGFGYRYVAEPA